MERITFTIPEKVTVCKATGILMAAKMTISEISLLIDELFDDDKDNYRLNLGDDGHSELIAAFNNVQAKLLMAASLCAESSFYSSEGKSM